MRWISLIGSVLRMRGRCDRRSNPCSKVVRGSLIGRLVPEHSMTVHQNRRIVVDGALMDNFRLTHGYWEAKDEDDDLPSEVVNASLREAIPATTSFSKTPHRAILWQNESADA